MAFSGSFCVGDGLSFKFYFRIAWMFYGSSSQCLEFRVGVEGFVPMHEGRSVF